MECEVCGSASALKKARVEGTLLKVCEKCARLGNVVDEPLFLPPKRKAEQTFKESIIDPDFANKIKKARKNIGLTIEELSKKISVGIGVVERIERGMRPTDEVARKLEKVLRIKLLDFSLSAEQKTNVPGENQMTVGDIADLKIKKK
ncbi:MAG: multiprotein-bridging factor 1 family protein [Candidatus Aenigmarchaeota archaeon]|nr:multiprotein-bridging factor 1 family protein [Candidatus Aenigmarchaeota archaeon]MDI6722374.1 multiprotein-bridging factor 1 family protein [Candidatus Aenigmarchaeota archaeon]